MWNNLHTLFLEGIQVLPHEVNLYDDEPLVARYLERMNSFAVEESY